MSYHSHSHVSMSSMSRVGGRDDLRRQVAQLGVHSLLYDELQTLDDLMAVPAEGFRELDLEPRAAGAASFSIICWSPWVGSDWYSRATAASVGRPVQAPHGDPGDPAHHRD